MKEEVNELLKNDNGFMGSNKFIVKEINKDKCIIEYEIKEDGLNPYGIIHGGLLFGLADSACGILSTVNEKKCVTTSGNINYLRVTKDKKIIAVSTIIKDGKNIGYYKCDIEDSDGLIATANINLYYLSK